MVAWDRHPMRVKVGPWPDETGWSEAYERRDRTCCAACRESTPDQRLVAIFILFSAIVVREGLDAEIVHQAFLAIDDYREALDGRRADSG
jgi:hypothetical protein